MIHKPVLLKEAIEVLNPKPGEFFIDGTFGAGGHTVEILKRIMPGGRFLGIDLDRGSLEAAKKKISTEFRIKNLELRNNIIFFQGNYADIPEILKKINMADPSIPLRVNGLIVDLGLSSDQLEDLNRGFSFLRNEILDMRFNREGGAPTAAEIINSSSEKELTDIFWKYGEERNSGRIAKEIVEKRRKNRIKTTFELAEIVENAVSRRGKIHPATKVFQALRIYVNDELGNLERLLKNLGEILKPQGRTAIISYHSLEDRLVKNYFRDMAKSGGAEILTKKPIIPSQEEIKNNQRSRSAKLRAIKYDHNPTS
ncbi:16S rRNA (cytosine(1402)-N(4))-methyltransferase [Candidatus Wolfebacteria bacterium RBG_13_41_7]|uniref:Ribosomal RNA small subunit methyltransferase H n=1 Tax=Candidatus Wolfebacteria bacterium RBG_13_41_7 TaxID=1802554 RepID=A0A1F8DL22_9BACT|nr:MAG: 16S rRNA (cytosine(1402)-N(4))-methyltransferase [Candidatus Wolfebacteria bacterium RBG_13_41_7]